MSEDRKKGESDRSRRLGEGRTIGSWGKRNSLAPDRVFEKARRFVDAVERIQRRKQPRSRVRPLLDSHLKSDLLRCPL